MQLRLLPSSPPCDGAMFSHPRGIRTSAQSPMRKRVCPSEVGDKSMCKRFHFCGRKIARALCYWRSQTKLYQRLRRFGNFRIRKTTHCKDIWKILKCWPYGKVEAISSRHTHVIEHFHVSTDCPNVSRCDILVVFKEMSAMICFKQC